MHPRPLVSHNDYGFTLAETAMVLAIFALVIGAMVPTLLSMRLAEQTRATASNLQIVMRSIAGFVQSAGCLPCPLAADNIGANIAACAACTTSVGIVPFHTLGLPQNAAKDAYGHWLTYAVDTKLARLPNTAQPMSATNNICVHTKDATTQLKVQPEIGNEQNYISVMLLSHGANGFGAYKNLPETATDRMPNVSCSASSRAEIMNACDTRSFVAALPAQGSSPFDDVYLYLGRNALVTYLGNLPCTTPWEAP
jgi:type II secretory pathway pseudopilin PulG